MSGSQQRRRPATADQEPGLRRATDEDLQPREDQAADCLGGGGGHWSCDRPSDVWGKC